MSKNGERVFGIVRETFAKACRIAALLSFVIPFSGVAELVDTSNNPATNEMILGVIDMGKATIGDLSHYITTGAVAQANSYTDEKAIDATNTAITTANAYTDSKEFTREVYNAIEYFIVTNPPIDVTDASITNSFEEAWHGMAFDLYYTNSIYFIDEDNVPTLKFFAPKRRRTYFGNRFSAVEIGDFWQVFRTYNQQVDGLLAVQDPSCIKFMSTLDRNSAYDQGRTMTLQDYLDAFNPVLVPETISLFQTNHSNYSVGNMDVHGTFKVYGIDVSRSVIGPEYTLFNESGQPTLINGDWITGALHAPRTVVETVTTNELMSLSSEGLNYMNVFGIVPSTAIDYTNEMTNEYGQVTNWIQVVETNSQVKIKGDVAVNGNILVNTLVATNEISVYGFDDIVSRVWGWGIDSNGVRWVQKGTDGIPRGGQRLDLKTYVDFMVEPFISATNIYNAGDTVIEVHKPIKPRMMDPVAISGGNMSVHLSCPNKREIFYNAALCDNIFRHGSGYYTITNVGCIFSHPAGYTTEGDSFTEVQHLDTTITFDLSSCGHSVRLDFGQNFASINGDTNDWDTIFSTVEPNIQVVQVLRTGETTTYDMVYDEDIGDWVQDLENPHTTISEWYDSYEVDMAFDIEPYTCKQFKFKQCGDRTMMVEIRTLYKTMPQNPL